MPLKPGKKNIGKNIKEMENVLGVEAARESILSELTEVIEFDGAYINDHHKTLLADRMTSTTPMTSIFRHGVNKDDIGPIAKASFEETPEMFLQAARHAEVDNMRGVSANVMCGQEGYYGTSCFQVILDMNQLTQNITEDEYEKETEKVNIDKAFEDVLEQDNCSISNLKIVNNVSNITNITKEDKGINDKYELDI